MTASSQPPDSAAALLARHPDPALVIDDSGAIVWSNDAAHAHLGTGDVVMHTLASLGLALADVERAARAPLEVRIGRATHQTWHWRLRAADPVDGHRLLLFTPTENTATRELARSRDAALAELAAAVDVGQIAIWRRVVGTRVVRFNEVARAWLDLNTGTTEHDVDTLMGRLHPHDQALIRRVTAQSLERRGPTDFDMRVQRHDGAWREVHTRLVVDRDQDGSPLEWIGVSLDVTSQREDARHTRELLRRFNLAARTAGIGHWSLESGATVARWSEQLYAMHGLAQSEPVPPFNEWLKRHVHEQDRERVFHAMRDWAQSGKPSQELRFRLLRSDGAVLHIISHSHIEGQGEQSLEFGIVIDVTARHAAETALRQAAERAALIAHGVGIGTWELDLVSGEALWDEQMHRLRGLQVQARALGPQERLRVVHPGDQDQIVAVAARMEAETGPIDHEFRVIWPDGSTRWIASRSSAVCDDAGRPLRRVGVNWDITDARSAIAERQERLAAQHEVRAKAQFLSRMSHELRTPLNAVLGFTQLIRDEGDAATADTRRRRLDHIQAAGSHLLSLIDDVLDLSKLEGGEVAVELQPVDLPALMQDLLPLVESLARECGVQLRTGDLGTVPLADATRLRQVLLNLLTNAIKYNRRGGEVLVESATLQGVAVLRVTDNGHGMSPEQLQHLFEPFNRLGAERYGIAGTGIGLAIVKAMVERMGGTVHVESEVNRGSVFEVRLRDGRESGPPQVELASPQAMALAATSGRVGRGGTVLYIEDNTVNAMIVGELMAQRGDLKLLNADTGEGGLNIAVSARPHLVLLDMQLPDIDGFEVFARLQAHPRTARIPCIALSANALPEDIDRAMRAGFADYWTKPLDFRNFTATIEALFGPAP